MNTLPFDNNDRPLQLGDDRELRRFWFVPESFTHPAKLNLKWLDYLLDRYTLPGQWVGDPMAGTGSLMIAAVKGRNVILREVEDEWVSLLHRNAAHVRQQMGWFATGLGRIDVGQADARQPWNFQPDVVLFSPPYGCNSSPNRAKRSKVLTMRLLESVGKKGRYSKRWEILARNNSPGATALFTFAYGNHKNQIGHWRGKRYWRAMREIYQQGYEVLPPGGLMILVLKDHIYKGRVVETCNLTIQLCQELGFELKARHQRQLSKMALWTRRRKEKGLPVVAIEEALVFGK